MTTFRTERDRLEYEKWAEQDRKEQAAIAEKLERPILEAQLKKELEQTAGKLFAQKRRLALYGHHENPFIPADLPRFDNPEELERFNRAEAAAFFSECKEWEKYASQQNIRTMLDYYQNRNIFQVDRRMWNATFCSLLNDGVFEEPSAPAPVTPVAAPVPVEDLENLPRLPLSFKSPAGWKRDVQGTQTGIDPATGLPRTYTDVEISLMTSELYKRIFSVPTPALTRVNFLQR